MFIFSSFTVQAPYPYATGSHSREDHIDFGWSRCDLGDEPSCLSGLKQSELFLSYSAAKSVGVTLV